MTGETILIEREENFPNPLTDLPFAFPVPKTEAVLSLVKPSAFASTA